MPEIIQKYSVKVPNLNSFYVDSLEILKNMGAQEIKEETSADPSKTFSGVIPSIWGWGGMKLTVNLTKSGENTYLQLTGYIAQLSTSPLTQQMDKFLSAVQSLLKQKYGQNFEYKKLSGFLPSCKISINDKDRKAFLIITVGTFLIALVGSVAGHGLETLLSVVVLFLGYKFGKDYFYRK